MDPEYWREIEELYDAARKREPSERNAFLAAACRGKQELRRNLELLLAQDVSQEGVLEHPAWEGAAVPIEKLPEVLLTPGEHLGPYEIKALLGEGGMGQVFRARDTRLNRLVAIKVSKDRFTERFQREVRAIAALNHPNICSLYDVGPNY